MNWRRLWLWLVVLVAMVLLLRLDRRERRTTAPSPPAAPASRPAGPIDLTRHDGAAIDFSSGRPVIKDAPADRAAVAREVKAMEDAAREVTFQPAPSTVKEQAPVSPPPEAPRK